MQSQEGHFNEGNEALRMLERDFGVINVVLTSLEVRLPLETLNPTPCIFRIPQSLLALTMPS